MNAIKNYLKTQNINFNNVLNGIQFNRSFINYDVKNELIKMKANITYLDTTVYVSIG